MNIFANSSIASILGAHAGFLLGICLVSLSGLVATPAYNEYFEISFGMIQGCVTASMHAGSMLGVVCFSISVLYERLSRPVLTRGLCVLYTIGTVLQGTATDIYTLILGRSITGLGLGGISVMIPIYQQEICEISARVSNSLKYRASVAIGMLFGFSLQYVLSFMDQGHSKLIFRLPLFLQALPAISLFLVLFKSPHSPLWLASKDRWDEAIKVLASIHTSDGNIRDPKVLEQCRLLEDSIRFEAGTTYRSLPQATKKKLAVSIGLEIWSGLSGNKILIFYGIYLMQTANIGSPFLLTLLQFVLITVTFLLTFTFDYVWKRRIVTILACVSLTILMSLIGILEVVGGRASDHSGSLVRVSWLIQDNPVISLILVGNILIFATIHTATLGQLTTKTPFELFSNSASIPLVVAISTKTVEHSMDTLLALFIPSMLLKLSWRIFIVFGVFNLLAGIHLYIFLPETKNANISDLDRVFETMGWLHPVGLRQTYRRATTSEVPSFEMVKADTIEDIHWWERSYPQGPAVTMQD